MKNRRWLPLLLLAAGVWVTAPACAGRIQTRTGRPDFGRNVQRHGYDEGRRRGFDRGRNDARKGRPQAWERFKEYRNGNAGYRREDGDRNAYREAFRQGFRDGYEDGFRQRRDGDDRNRRR